VQGRSWIGEGKDKKKKKKKKRKVYKLGFENEDERAKEEDWEMGRKRSNQVGKKGVRFLRNYCPLPKYPPLCCSPALPLPPCPPCSYGLSLAS